MQKIKFQISDQVKKEPELELDPYFRFHSIQAGSESVYNEYQSETLVSSSDNAAKILIYLQLQFFTCPLLVDG